MIFAAGRGTRLGDLGLATPKALIKINNSTAIEQIINKIIQLDIKEIIINELDNNDSLQDIAVSIAIRARTVSLMPVSKQKDGTMIGPVTPYSILAQKFNDPDFLDGLGGKVDDISGILIRCS